MFEELIKINNKLLILYKDKDSERLKRQILISKLLTEKECFHIMNIEGLKINLDENNVNQLENFDYVIDACDDINAKLALMEYASRNNIKLISSMGTGKRLNPSNVIITRLDKTSNDPLAKKMRYEARKRGLKLNIPVVCSKEEPINNDRIIASSIFVPSTAGLMLAYYIIEKVIND